MKSAAMITFDLSAYLSFSRNRRGGTHIRLIYLLSNNNSIIFDEAVARLAQTREKKDEKESILCDTCASVYTAKRSLCDMELMT